MRRSLLNKRILPKPLRQALVLITLLLLPSAAWGQTTYQGGTYNSDNSTWGDWNVEKNGIGDISESSGQLVFNVSSGSSTGSITLSLAQTKNTTEKICKIYISTNKSSGVSLASAKIVSSDGQTDPIDLTEEFLSNGSYRYYIAKTPDEWGEGKEIVITLDFDFTQGSDYAIAGAEVTTGTPYDLIVGGITVTNVNQDNVTGIEKDDVAEVIFTPETSKLALNSVELTSPIQLKNSMSSLTIDLQGTCSITTGNEVTISSESDANITFTSTSSTKGTLSLKRNDGTGLISNITPTYNDELVAVIVNPTNVSTLADAKEAVILESYGLTIAGVAVTSANVDSDGKITGIAAITDGTVKFTPAEGSNSAKLQLYAATIFYESGNVIVSTSTSPLEVNLYYSSSIISGNYLPFEGATGDLIFTAVDNDEDPVLTLKSTHPDFGSSSFSSGFNQVSYPKKDSYLSLIAAEEESDGQTIVKIREPESYGLAIGGVDVTEANANNISGENIIAYEEGKDSKVSFTPKKDDSTPAKLELKNAKITGYAGIFWGKSEELCIEISGNNSVENLENGIMANAISAESSDKLTIQAANGTDATLKLSNSVGGEVQAPTYTDIDNFTTTDFTTLTKYPRTTGSYTPIKEGSYYYSYYTTYDVYDLWIGGTQVHAIPDLSRGYKDDVLGDGKEEVKFTPASEGTSSTLTLDNANIGEIISGLSSLTIHVVGENVTRYIEALSSASGALTLEKENANSLLTFDVTDVSVSSFIFGFTSFNNDFTLFGFNGDSPSALSGSFTYNTSNHSLEWSDPSTNLPKMVACILFEGDGNETPYKIQNANDLAKLSKYVNQGIISNQKFQLMVDLDDCSGISMDPIGSDPYNGSLVFKGTFDGNNKTIQKLTMTTNSAISFGLFGNVDGGTIKNLTLENCTITGCYNSYCPTGAIAGKLISGSITNCIVKNSTIKAQNNAYSPYVGGIVGLIAGGEISQCEANNVTVSAITSYNGSGAEVAVGGIVGYGSEGTVNACKVTGESKITGSNTISSSKVGAVIGNISGSTLTGNFYEYDTEVYAKSHDTFDENDYEKDYTGYDHRGAGCDAKAVTDPTGAVMYTKDVSIPATAAAEMWVGLEHSYYKANLEGDPYIYSVAPEQEIDLYIMSYVVKGTYTLDEETKTIELKKEENEMYWYSFTMPDSDVTFTAQEAAVVSFSEEGDQTFATYYNATKDMAVPMGMTAYMVTGISEDGTKIIVSPVSYIKAGVAVLIEKDKTTEVSETTDFSGSKLVHAENDVPATENTKLYVLYNNKYVKVTAGTKILSGSCYLNLSGVANTRGFYEIGGGEGTTSLREVKTDVVNSEKLAYGEWFTLQGQRVTKPAKGLYILNGKKVVVK